MDRLLRVRIGAFGAALLVALACGQGERKGPGELPVPAPAQREGLAPGEARVSVNDGRVTIECQNAPRGLVLEKLAREARFELAGEVDARPLTLDLKQQRLEPVIAAVLEDLGYRARWSYDARTDRHELTRLEVGEVQLASAGADGRDPAARAKRKALADARRKQQREQQGVGEEQRAEMAARYEERERSQADLLEQLRSSNPEMRIEAVEGLDPEGPALVVLLEVLRTDPDVRVRQKAAEQGGEAQGFLACQGLLDALGDREPAVVMQALASIEFTCDETVGPIVQQRCAQAVDPEVHARCAEAIEFLE